MSKLIILFTTTLLLQYSNAQDFKTTTDYVVANRMDTKQQEYATALFDVVVADAPSQKVATLSILDLDFFEDITISSLANPELNQMKEILKVDVNYNSCCIHSETYYFMVTATNDFIALPYIENTYCATTASEVRYVFPTQTLGKTGLILKTKVQFTENNTVKDTQILQRFAWNDDHFNANDAIAYTGTDNN